MAVLRQPHRTRIKAPQLSVDQTSEYICPVWAKDSRRALATRAKVRPRQGQYPYCTPYKPTYDQEQNAPYHDEERTVPLIHHTPNALWKAACILLAIISLFMVFTSCGAVSITRLYRENDGSLIQFCSIALEPTEPLDFRWINRIAGSRPLIALPVRHAADNWLEFSRDTIGHYTPSVLTRLSRRRSRRFTRRAPCGSVPRCHAPQSSHLYICRRAASQPRHRLATTCATTALSNAILPEHLIDRASVGR